MGTTQRISPGVTGEPNWGISNSVTAVANIVAHEEQAAANNVADDTGSLERRRSRNIGNAVGRLIRSAGGRQVVKTGSSSKLGKAGKIVAIRLGAFISDVNRGGLELAFQNLGLQLGSLDGLSVQDVIWRIVKLCSEESTGMDEVAANAACNHVLQKMAEENPTWQEYEDFLKEAFQNIESGERWLSEYFGYYIFEHLSVRYE